ncbi:uncharacterized protein [Leptinotarsa decemlineata]|uniref:uncharacterized protein n=1 Tax=Leptinotarsa decemlineata TaxID=7539 RepID=UPI003D3093E5
MDSGSVVLTTMARRYDFLNAIIGKDVIVKSIHGEWFRGVLFNVDISLNIVLCRTMAMENDAVNKEVFFIRSDTYLYIGIDDGSVIIEEPNTTRKTNEQDFEEDLFYTSNDSEKDIFGISKRVARQNSLEISTENL